MPVSHTTSHPLSRIVAGVVAGHIALDFCNTAGEHLAPAPDELLVDWETFIRWAVQAGLLSPESYTELTRRPSEMLAVLKLRDAIYSVSLAVARSTRIPRADLDHICEQAKLALPPVVSGPAGVRWRPRPQHASEQLRGLLANQALSLICSPRAARIGVCQGGLCGWLFLDDSRGMRRRWCDMKDCGNRAKARRYTARHKS